MSLGLLPFGDSWHKNNETMAIALPTTFIFNGEDYYIWMVKMHTLLRSQNLLRCIEPAENEDLDLVRAGKNKLNEKDRILDAKALVFLQQGVSNEIFRKIKYAVTARQAWLILDQEFYTYDDVSEDEGQRFSITNPLENMVLSYQLNQKIGEVKFTVGYNSILAKYIEPRAVAIGPFYHFKAWLHKGESLKTRLASIFYSQNLKDNIHKNDPTEKIKEKIVNLRNCYVEYATDLYRDDDVLASMLLIDGCAVLQFIYLSVNDRLYDVKILDEDASLDSINADLFLVGNQLPFLALDLIMESSSDPEELWYSVAKFIDMNSMAPAETDKWSSQWTQTMRKLVREQQRQGDFSTHLLGLLWARRTMLGNSFTQGGQSMPCFSRRFRRHRQSGTPSNWRPRRTKELKVGGIQLKPCRSGCFQDISFSRGSFSVLLTLPPIIVDPSTAYKLLNLLAYELSHFSEDEHKFYVTSYIPFLDSFIARPEDISLLQSEGILYNNLGKDEEVVKLIHEMAGISRFFYREHNTYMDVKDSIDNYFRRGWRVKTAIWLNEAKEDYGSNPWKIIGVSAAAFAIAVTVVQTYFTIFPLK